MESSEELRRLGASWYASVRFAQAARRYIAAMSSEVVRRAKAGGRCGRKRRRKIAWTALAIIYFPGMTVRAQERATLVRTQLAQRGSIKGGCRGVRARALRARSRADSL